MTEKVEERLTIDQLARRTGMTVRSIRLHQERGLLPRPELRGRTGYYGAEHLERIALIKELRADGFSLVLIGRALENANGSIPEVLRFTRALREPFGEEQPQVVDALELAKRWGTTDPSLLSRGQELGLLRHLGGSRYEQLSPDLAEAGEELVRLGVSPKRVLEVAAHLRRQADTVAKTYVELFLDEIWRPFLEADAPEERWPEVSAALERLRPLAARSLLAVFQIAMSEAVERAFGRELARIGREAATPEQAPKAPARSRRARRA